MHSGYLSNVIRPSRRRGVVASSLDILRKHEFDTIAVRGISGISVGSILAHALDKSIAIVRKEGTENTHSENQMESSFEVEKYVIVDDFVSSGETLYHIERRMKQAHPNALCIGMLRYNREDFIGPIEVQNYILNFIRLFREKATLENISTLSTKKV